MICFEMDTRPSSFLLFLAIAMCSILCIFSVSVLLIFHCCRVKDLSHTISEKARASVMYARNSIFGVSGIELDEDDEYRDQLEAQWETMDPRENSTQSIPNAQKNLLLPSRWTKWGGRHSLAPTHCV